MDRDNRTPDQKRLEEVEWKVNLCVDMLLQLQSIAMRDHFKSELIQHFQAQIKPNPWVAVQANSAGNDKERS